MSTIEDAAVAGSRNAAQSPSDDTDVLLNQAQRDHGDLQAQVDRQGRNFYLRRAASHLLFAGAVIAFVAFIEETRALASAAWTMANLADLASMLGLAPIWAAWVIYLIYYRWRRRIDWEIWQAKMNSATQVESAEGFVQVFRIYVKSKRVYLYSLFGGVAAVFGALMVPEWTTATWVETVLGLAIVFVAVDIGQFLFHPGPAMINRVLGLHVRANHPDTPLNEQAEFIEAAIAEMKRRYPWWYAREM